jgi:hypothetical protein
MVTLKEYSLWWHKNKNIMHMYFHLHYERENPKKHESQHPIKKSSNYEINLKQ